PQRGHRRCDVAARGCGLWVCEPHQRAGQGHEQNTEPEDERWNNRFFRRNTETGEREYQNALAEAPAAGRDRDHGKQQRGRHYEKPLLWQDRQSEILPHHEKNQNVHEMGEAGQSEHQEEGPAYGGVSDDRVAQFDDFDAQRMAAVPRAADEQEQQNRTRYGKDGNAHEKDDRLREARKQVEEAGEAHQYQQQQGTETDTAIDNKRFGRLAEREPHPVQEPEPHRVPADEPESDLLDEETAKRDL